MTAPPPRRCRAACLCMTFGLSMPVRLPRNAPEGRVLWTRSCLRCVASVATGDWLVLDIVISGVRLQEIARAAEASNATERGQAALAGDYMGLDLSVASTQHLLGQPVVMSLRGEPVEVRALLRCTCGESGCGALRPKVVQVSDEVLIWSDFHGSAVPGSDLSIAARTSSTATSTTVRSQEQTPQRPAIESTRSGRHCEPGWWSALGSLALAEAMISNAAMRW
jgi:hypothetical protein